MIEVLRTNDAVKLSYATALLKDAGCYPQVVDRFMSAMEGSVAAIQRRVLVPDEYAEKAKRVLVGIDDPPPPPDDWPPEDGPEESGA